MKQSWSKLVEEKEMMYYICSTTSRICLLGRHMTQIEAYGVSNTMLLAV